MPDTQALNPNNNQNPGLLEEVALEDMLNARERRAAHPEIPSGRVSLSPCLSDLKHPRPGEGAGPGA